MVLSGELGTHTRVGVTDILAVSPMPYPVLIGSHVAAVALWLHG